MTDAEAMLKIMREASQRRVTGMPGRHDQMGGQRRISSAH